MSSKSQNNYPEIGEILDELDRLSTQPPVIDGQADNYLAKMCTAVAEIFRENEELTESMMHGVSLKSSFNRLTTTYLVNFITKLVQKELMHEVEYPFETVDEYLTHIRKLFDDQEQRQNFGYNLRIWNVGSDIEWRSAALKLIPNWLMKRNAPTSSPTSYLIVGAASNHGLPVIEDNLQFPLIEVDDENLSADQQQYVQYRLNSDLRQAIELNDAVGVDHFSLKDSDYQEFLRACRFRPLEYKDYRAIKRYERLKYIVANSNIIKQATIDFASDISYPNPNNNFLQHMEADKKFDIVAFPTCLHQNQKKAVAKMLANGISRCSGLVVVQDFVRLNPNFNASQQPLVDQLVFVDDWHEQEYSYRTLVFDPKRPEQGFREFLLWNNSRCQKAKLGELAVDCLKVEQIASRVD